MGLRAAEELLFESESTLRLVDSVLTELEAIEAEVSRSEDEVRQLSVQVSRAHAGIADLPSISMIFDVGMPNALWVQSSPPVGSPPA